MGDGHAAEPRQRAPGPSRAEAPPRTDRQEENEAMLEKQRQVPTGKGPAARFTGDVYVDMIVTHPDAGFSVGAVHFTPGAHTAWHSHAAGQMLHCTEGVGLVVTADEVIVLRPGVTVWTPPDQRHWHGAVPTHSMAHFAMSGVVELAEGQEAVTWQEHVDDDDYAAAAAIAAPMVPRDVTLIQTTLQEAHDGED
jgi:quercetin dioxygenase-like cupin family protein